MQTFDTNDTAARALIGATASDMALLRSGTVPLVAAALRRMRDEIRATNDDPRASTLARTERIAAARDAAVATFDTLETRAKTAADDVRAAIGKATQQPTDVQSRILRELEVQSGWQRAQLMLSGGADLIEIARTAGESGDTALVAALRTYAGAYLAGKPDVYVEAVMKTLDRAEVPSLSAAQTLGRALAEEIAAGMPLLDNTFNHARYEATGRGEVGYLFDWVPGKAYQTHPAIPAGTPPFTPPQPTGRG